MAEYSYLATRRLLGGERTLLSAKRRIAPMWALLFATNELDARRLRVEASATDAAERLRRRTATLAGVAGPMLRSVIDGFVDCVTRSDASRWVLDARELGAYPHTDRELLNLLRWAERLDGGPDDVALDEVDDDGAVERVERRGRVTYELTEEGVDGSYPLFGGSTDDTLPWLRPASPDDDRVLSLLRRAFAGFRVASPPTASEDAIRLQYTHPAHRDVRFFVDTNLAFWGERADGARILFGPIEREAQLFAWAAHVGEHLQLLAFPPPGVQAWWWTCAGANGFSESISPLEEDLASFRRALGLKLAQAMMQRAGPRATLPGQRGPVDLGPLGCADFVHVTEPGWEPHVRAVLHRTRGDAFWHAPDPGVLAPPSMQHAEATAFLASLAEAAQAGGAVVRATAEDATDVIFTIHADRIEPERFVVEPRGRWDVTVPARRLDSTEVRGEYAFVGSGLVIVVADGTRTAFKLPVPSDLDRSVAPMVSGFWTATSGERFASVLRVGQRVWRFDNMGRLLSSP